jgi:predicted AlkP superfamily pyrophosphatase or phosphodiesterase
LTAGRRRWAVALSALALAGCAAAAHDVRATAAGVATTSAGRPYVVLVSFDAFRHDYVERLHPPVVERLAARGVRAEGLIPSFPSKTFPNHYTIVTGLHPGHHGIVGNSFYDPARNAWYRSSDSVAVRDASWYGGEPIWVTAERNGVRTAAYFWPGSEAAIGGVRPSAVVAYDGRVPNDQRVDGVAAWLRRPAAERPHLVLLYMSDIDDTTHRYGPDAANTANAVANVDHALGRLLDSIAALPIRDSVNVVLVSDHGMTTTSPERTLPVFDALTRAGLDTAGIRASDNGPTMSLWFAGRDAARIARARSVLAAALAHADVYTREEVPARLHLAGNARGGDLLLVGWPGNILLRRASDRYTSLGAHGFDPAWEDMHGIFIAAGPNVRAAGRIPRFENVNIYPFLAALLRLEKVPAVDGSLEVLGGYVK